MSTYIRYSIMYMRSVYQIQRQIDVLQKKLVNMSASLVPQKGLWAIAGKIKRLEKELREAQQQEFLGR